MLYDEGTGTRQNDSLRNTKMTFHLVFFLPSIINFTRQNTKSIAYGNVVVIFLHANTRSSASRTELQAEISINFAYIVYFSIRQRTRKFFFFSPLLKRLSNRLETLVQYGLCRIFGTFLMFILFLPSRSEQIKYRGILGTQKSGINTCSGKIDLNIRILAILKLGQDQVSRGISVLCWNAAPVANVLRRPRTIT